MTLEEVSKFNEFLENVDFDIILRLIKVSKFFLQTLPSLIKVIRIRDPMKTLRISNFDQIEGVIYNVRLLYHPKLRCPRLKVGRIIINQNSIPSLKTIFSWLPFPSGYCYELIVPIRSLTSSITLTDDRCSLDPDTAWTISESGSLFSNNRDTADQIQVIRLILMTRPALKLVIKEEHREFFFKSGLFNHQQLVVV